MHTAQTIAQARAEAIAAYRADGKPQTFFRVYGNALDACMQAWAVAHFSGSHWCLLAIGGFGRHEMYPFSDVDLALVYREPLSVSEQETVAAAVQQLWDMKLTPALKTGSLKQLLLAANEDLTAQTAFLEARFLAGNQAFAKEAAAAFRQQTDRVMFIENKLLEMQQRHQKQPALVLEPNVKNGAGSLRDLHTMMWLAKVQGLQANFYALMRRKIITPTEAGVLQTCYRRMARFRIELHWAAQREEDRLVFDLQAVLAAQFGLNQDGVQAGMEHLMRLFYRTAKTIMQLNGILIPMLCHRVYSRLPRVVGEINADYYHVNGQIAAKDLSLFQQQPEHLFIIVSLLQQHRHVHAIAPKTLRAWWSASRLMDEAFYRNPANRQRFLCFFQAGEGLTHTLRLLNLYGLLARYLPQWANIVGLLQHDLVHIYPVDDHILTVLRNMRRLAMERHSHELPFASTLFHHFPQEKQYILYLATLFHDIAKGRSGDHAALGQVDARRFAQDHGLPAPHADLLCWLVQEHLLMSMTAQKEDIQDVAVIAKFCGKVQTHERLNALYLLTVADIRGTNPKIWNAWKAQLLQSLFQAAERYLDGQQTSPERAFLTRKQRAHAILHEMGLSPQKVNHLMHALGDAYFLRHSSDTVIWHLQHIAPAPDVSHVALRPWHDDMVQIMIFMPNAERLFTRICRIIGRHGFGIGAARALLTTHDFILNTFTLTPTDGSHVRDVAVFQAALMQELHAFAQSPGGSVGVLRHKPSRRARWQPIAPHVRMEADVEQPQQYSIEVITADRPYLLADITEILARHQVSVRYAKISTLGERAEDSFIVSCPDWSAAKQYALIQDLLAVLH